MAIDLHLFGAHVRITNLAKNLEMTNKALSAVDDRINDLAVRLCSRDHDETEKTERIFRDAVIQMTEEETDAEFLRRCAREADRHGLLPHERDKGIRTGAARRLERLALKLE
jgi:phosphate uptake regulator